VLGTDRMMAAAAGRLIVPGKGKTPGSLPGFPPGAVGVSAGAGELVTGQRVFEMSLRIAVRSDDNAR
jgi:hypothetical protein